MQKSKINDIHNEHQERKRSSGIFSFLKLFYNKSVDRDSFSDQSSVISVNSIDSKNTIVSTGTIASFVFLRPSTYRFFRRKPTIVNCLPNNSIVENADTYRKRIEKLEIQRKNDCNLTLRRKYKLSFISLDAQIDKVSSLPVDKKTNHTNLRRSFSDSCDQVVNRDSIKRKRLKRKAPIPPKMVKDVDIIRRKKRQAPQPPLELFQLNKEDVQVPKPWYKRSISVNKESKNRLSKYSEILPIAGFLRSKDESLKSKLKRKSGLTFLTNISDLDKEANEILKSDKIKNEIPEFMKPKYFQQSQISGFDSTKNAKNTKDLIAKFNAITDTAKVTVSTNFVKNDKELVSTKEVIEKKDNESNGAISIFSDTKKQNNWICPRCALENDYWRILCYVCNCIKPLSKKIYPKLDNVIENTKPTSNIIKNKTIDDSNIYSSFENTSTLRIDDTVSNSHQLKKSASSSKVAQYITEPTPSTSSVTKQEEQLILKQMLIEMKNSLPKRPKKKFEIFIGTKETSYENIKVRKDQKNPIKVSSATQTNMIKLIKREEEMYTDDNPYEPIDWKAFKSIEKGNLIKPNMYSNVEMNKQSQLNVSTLMKITRKLPKDYFADTIEINKLLKKLETAISGGKRNQAAQLARELAHLQINCSVIRQKITPVLNNFELSFFVQDRNGRKGPYEIWVDLSMTIDKLKKAVQLKFNLPFELQKWVFRSEILFDNKQPLKQLGIIDGFEPLFLYLVQPEEFSDKNELQSKNWSCPMCTLINSSDVKNCVTCFAQNPNEQKFVKLNINKHMWKCNACTFINENGLSNCLACFTQNPNEPKLQQNNTKKRNVEENAMVDPLRMWKCEACTFINLSDLRNCLACFALNKNEPKLDIIEKKNYDIKVQEEEDPIVDPLRMWKCTACTFINSIEFRNCTMCYANNSMDQNKNNKNYLELINLDEQDLVLNTTSFECLICLSEVEKDDGVILRDCFHKFCADCLKNLIKTSDEAEVKCPYRDKHFVCNSILQDREIKSLISKEDYDKFLTKSLNSAEAKLPNSYHCKTTDCTGWCTFENDVNVFHCPVCNKVNCLTCQAIHTGHDCKQYQEYLRDFSTTDKNAAKTYNIMQKMLLNREAMRCPTCKIIIMKKEGCDALMCIMCHTELCWATRGPRWGPNGHGDVTGGCKCGVGGTKCHPMCINCH